MSDISSSGKFSFHLVLSKGFQSYFISCPWRENQSNYAKEE